MSERLPARFGRYTLLSRLATGGMAELLLALDPAPGSAGPRVVVVKRVLPSLRGEATYGSMLLHEARVGSRLAHPNVGLVLDSGTIDGLPFVTFEHLRGADLRAVFEAMGRRGLRELPLGHAIAIAIGVAAALAHAHDAKGDDGAPLDVVHRDVSPPNVLVAWSGEVKLVDFGIATSAVRDPADDTMSGKLKGKVAYMSPEQARGERVDRRSDLFSLGTLLYELTTGKRLFKGQSEIETIALVTRREVPPPSEVVPGYPPALERIVLRALSKDPAARQPGAAELQAELEAFARDAEVEVSREALAGFVRSLFADTIAREEETIARAIEAPRRGRITLRAALGAGLVVLAIALGWLAARP